MVWYHKPPSYIFLKRFTTISRIYIQLHTPLNFLLNKLPRQAYSGFCVKIEHVWVSVWTITRKVQRFQSGISYNFLQKKTKFRF